MSYNDLRDFLKILEDHGEVTHINGANWDLEMASIAEISAREGKDPKPALLFDNIPGYPAGYRTLFGMLVSPRKIAMTLGLPEESADRLTVLRSWLDKSTKLRPIPAKKVASGPVLSNSLKGSEIDLLKFPSPRFHELDTQRYIGTGCCNIQADPDSGWVNLGTYRNMVVDKNRTAIHAVEARHGSLIMEKYTARKTVMPFAIAIGVDPALYWASCSAVPSGVSEYDYAGAIKGEPLEVVEGPMTGLPLPANAEIVIEGEWNPGDLVDEGPFGEWHGYYANLGLRPVPEPLVNVTAIHFRDNPILSCAHVAVPPNDMSLQHAIGRSAKIWGRLNALDIPGIKGVWCHEAGCGTLFCAISIEQQYAGHAQEVGIIASQHHGGIQFKYIVVVDDDVDPSNLEQVLWATVTRAYSDKCIQILENCPSSSNDPSIPLSEKARYRVTPKPLMGPKFVINGCRPFEYKDEWYPIARVSPELRQSILQKWQSIIKI